MFYTRSNNHGGTETRFNFGIVINKPCLRASVVNLACANELSIERKK